mgnify:CR=1 FL=1
MAESNDKDSAPATPASADSPSNAGDKLALHEVLADEHDPCNVSANLHFRYDAANGVTTVEVTTGASGAPQSIVLPGADLTSGGSLSDTQIIQMLLAQSKPFD